jgi:hypothetical protein
MLEGQVDSSNRRTNILRIHPVCTKNIIAQAVSSDKQTNFTSALRDFIPVGHIALLKIGKF